MSRPSIALLVDGPLLPSGEGASYHSLTSARLLAKSGFPVTVMKAWRGWSDPELLAAEPYETVLWAPEDFYGVSEVFARFLYERQFAYAQSKLPSVIGALAASNVLPAFTRLVFECHDLPGPDSQEMLASSIADVVIALSGADARTLRSRLDVQVHHCAGFVSANEIQPRRHQHTGKRIGMLGNFFYEPNAQSVALLAHQVLPALRTLVPGAELHVIGPFPAGLPAQFQSAGLIWHGHCTDPVAVLRTCDTAVSYLLEGSGFRMKLLHYFAAGLPVVANELGIGGFDGASAVTAFAAYPGAVVQQLARLLADGAARQVLADGAQALLRKQYTETRRAEDFASVYQAVHPRRRRAQQALAAMERGMPHWTIEFLDKGKEHIASPMLARPGVPCVVSRDRQAAPCC